MRKGYKDMILRCSTFSDRLKYLQLVGKVASETFGFDRYLNQILYHSLAWKEARRFVILRDQGCDLACPDREIFSGLIVHHITPLTKKDIERKSRLIFDPNNLICTTHATHQAIHYGSDTNVLDIPKLRTAGDTTLWK